MPPIPQKVEESLVIAGDLRDRGRPRQAVLEMRRGALLAEQEGQYFLAAAIHAGAWSLGQKFVILSLSARSARDGIRSLVRGGDPIATSLASLVSRPHRNDDGSVSLPFALWVGLVEPQLDEDVETRSRDPLLALSLMLAAGNSFLRWPLLTMAEEAFLAVWEHPHATPTMKKIAAIHLAWVQVATGKGEEALGRLQEATNFQEGATVEEGVWLAAWGGVLLTLGREEEAQQAFDRALKKCGEEDRPLEAGRLWLCQGHLLLQKDRIEGAEKAFQEALATIPGRSFGISASDSNQMKRSEVETGAWWGLGVVARRQGRNEEARRMLRHTWARIQKRGSRMDTPGGKAQFGDAVQEIADILIEMEWERAADEPQRWWEILSLIEDSRGRAATSLRGNPPPRREGEGDDPPPRRREDVGRGPPGGFHRRPGGGNGFGPGAGPGRGPDGSIRPGRGPRRNPPIQLPDVYAPEALWEELPRPKTGEDPRLVFHLLPRRTLVMVVRPGNIQAKALDIGAEEWEGRVLEIRRALGVAETMEERLRERKVVWDGVLEEAPPASPPRVDGDEEAWSPLLRALWRDLVSPLLHALPRKGTPLHVEPHRALWLLPLACLQDENGLFMGEHWPLIHRVAFTPRFTDSPSFPESGEPHSPQGYRVLAVGNPQAGVPDPAEESLVLPPLPGAAEEASRVAARFGGESILLLGEEATEARVLDAAKSCQVLHLATHALASESSPEACFLVLAGNESNSGRFTAQEVRQERWSQRLVTLSACQTAMGRVGADGVVGLASAFLGGGAQAVLVSLWSVNDDATRDWMDHFYRCWLEGESLPAAMESASRELRGRPSLRHPRLWGAFLLIEGNGA